VSDPRNPPVAAPPGRFRGRVVDDGSRQPGGWHGHFLRHPARHRHSTRSEKCPCCSSNKRRWCIRPEKSSCGCATPRHGDGSEKGKREKGKSGCSPRRARRGLLESHTVPFRTMISAVICSGHPRLDTYRAFLGSVVLREPPLYTGWECKECSWRPPASRFPVPTYPTLPYTNPEIPP